MSSLSFWAQAFDDVSPAHARLVGQDLAPDDTVHRQKLARLISNVAERGIVIFDKDGIRLSADGTHFIVKIVSSRLDPLGRMEPVVCHGTHRGTNVHTLLRPVENGFRDFADNSSIPLKASLGEDLQRAFQEFRRSRWIVIVKIWVRAVRLRIRELMMRELRR